MDNAPPPPKKVPANSSQPYGRPFGLPVIIMLILAGLAIVTILAREQSAAPETISYDAFVREVKAGNVASVQIMGNTLRGEFRGSLASDATSDKSSGSDRSIISTPPKTFSLELSSYIGDGLNQLLLDHSVRTEVKQPTDGTGFLLGLYMLVPLLLMAGFWITLKRARDPLGGTGFLGSFSKSPAKRYSATDKQTTFADVAGLDQVKEDLLEIVEFLKDPKKFQRLGGRVPKGVLLMGPPGTGKTLLARAVAGEAGVPFFSISGSEFIQMFVGVGASRVRDLFKTAKDASPAILFIDEIDAVGRVRGAGLGGGHDEREQTLNQILSEMDGFSPTESVIVLAATNRPDVLDPALLRPGRFDRHVSVDRPNQKARLALFNVHTRNVPLAKDVNLQRQASGTVGLTGADIRNLVNEAALWATRHNKEAVESSDFDYARDKVLMGPKREDVLIGREKTMTAYHEAGHALGAWLLPGVDKLHKVTIIPRGRALGVTQLVPEEDRLNIGESDLHNRLVFILAGRAAEKLVFGEYSAGAENDLVQATRLARRMVAHWGMSDRVGPVACHGSNEHPFLGRDVYEQREFGEHTTQIIDEEVTRLLNEAAVRSTHLLTENRKKLDDLASELEEREMLDDTEVVSIIGPATPRRSNENASRSEPGASVQAARDSQAS
ncbi:MAG: ATP-dependent metallopeptidase FtsH/Yme1/Tma family protein [Planctomycetota bacterium]|nr:MAG: ATP-dependent metallopeptidase FtsH/Yme1/Tma family protein [Planctomycetota bacterium]